MSFGDEVLDRLAPTYAWASDWPDVLERAEERRSTRLVTKRRVVIGFVLLAAVLVPLAALAAVNDWWFLKFGGPTPTSAPLVVKEGAWGGHPWQLIAYPSTTDGLCVSMTPKGWASVGKGGAMECGPFADVARTAETTASQDMTIAYLKVSATNELPVYIVGPVIDTALTVEVRFGNGQDLRVPTSPGPPPLDHVRFYATPIPADLQPTSKTFTTGLEWVAGLDVNGNVVACLAPLTANNGISPRSDCQ